MTTELYDLHLSLSRQMINWEDFQTKVINDNNILLQAKRSKLAKKFEQLQREQKKEAPPEVPPLENRILVRNESSETFTDEEMDLLEKGLKFSFCDTRNDVKEIIAHIEAGISSLPDETKRQLRDECKTQLQKNLNRCRPRKFKDSKIIKTIKALKLKDVYYMKADKGNTLVVLDKKDYHDRVQKLLQEGPYVKLNKNPLDNMIKEVKELVKDCTSIFGDISTKKLFCSNPTIPRLYCLPKIHKAGKKMRPIVSAVNSPSYGLSKFLVNKFRNLKYPSFGIKNNLELIDKFKDFNLQEGEILVSFDVTSLFPSIPLDVAYDVLEKIFKDNHFNYFEIEELLSLTRLCMQQNVFLYQGAFYKQRDGTSMGNPLSPFVADVVMGNLETLLVKQIASFPRWWARYVDDILSVFNQKTFDINEFLNNINKVIPSIQFTMEIEKEGKIPFLDLEVSRVDNEIKFDIYRKESNNNQFIIASSNHSFQHKSAAFQSGVHRLLTVPLNNVNFEKEKHMLKRIAVSNGYRADLIDEIIHNQLQKISNKTSTLTPFENNEKRIIIPFNGPLCKNLDQVFKKKNISIVYKNIRSLKSALGSPKDLIDEYDKSGIYKVKCLDCPTDTFYIGQTKRKIKTRFKEHTAHFYNDRITRSAIADHLIGEGHDVDNLELNLVKEINEPRLLNAWESLYIRCSKGNLINADMAPITSDLFKITELKL